MAELTLKRTFAHPPEAVFAFVTQTENLLKWWGPEGMHVPEHDLDLSRTGPWMSVMQNAEGQRYKVSGQVTSVDAPNSVGFTWAWHDENDQRGAESHVMFELASDGNGGTTFTLHHRNLPDDAADNHELGWTSSLRKLEALAA